jgi:hypothetical protein
MKSRSDLKNAEVGLKAHSHKRVHVWPQARPPDVPDLARMASSKRIYGCVSHRLSSVTVSAAFVELSSSQDLRTNE